MQRTDATLYRAKAAGRNRVEIDAVTATPLKRPLKGRSLATLGGGQAGGPPRSDAA